MIQLIVDLKSNTVEFDIVEPEVRTVDSVIL